MHTKNGNTMEPGDHVKLAGTKGKTAGVVGEIIGAYPDSEKFQVRWPDGREEWLPPGDLEKISG